MTDRDLDLVVLGGGPAGAVAAWLAAGDGLRVALVDPCGGQARIEGLSPRLHAWLDGRGLLAGFGGLVGPLARISHWGDQVRSDNGEWLVERAALDDHLRGAAVRAGAVLHRTTGRVAERQEGAVAVTLANGQDVLARRVFDARGRKAHAGREALRRGPATLSICGWVGCDPDRPPSVSILPVETGWLWIARAEPARAWVQFLGDADAPGKPADRLTEALSGVKDQIGAHGPVDPGGLVIRDSAPVQMPPSEDLSVICIGDAALAGDPLSGHGQFWAVSGALAATAVRRTLDARPGDPEAEALVRRFLAERAEEVFLRQARVGRDFIRMMPGFRDAPFWARRWAFPDDKPLHGDGGGVRTGRAVVVEDGVLRERDILRTPASPSGVAWFGTIPAVEAWDALAAGLPLDRLTAKWGEAARHLPRILARELAGRASGPATEGAEPG